MKDFTKYEYDQKLQDMTELLRNAEGWGDGYQSTTGQTLIQLMTDVTDTLHYMLERRTAESYLETAKLRSSIIARASELGYRYHRAVANNGYVEVTLVDEEGDPIGADSDIHIPRLTEIVSEGVTYYTTEGVMIASGQSSTTVQVRQGEMVVRTGMVDSEGVILFRDYEFFDNILMRVISDGEIYLDVVRDNSNVNKRALSFLQEGERFYDIKYTTEGMRLVFGDNTYGKRPSNEVTVSYLLVDPNEDPIITTDQVFETTTAITNVDGDNVDLFIKNKTPIRGYTPPETDLQIKRNAVTHHKTNGRATTNDDYSYWVKNSEHGNIVDARAFGEDELNTLVYNMNNVYITYLKEDGSDLTVEEEIDLRKFMDTVKTTQVHLILNNAGKLSIQAIIDAKKNKNNPVSNAEMYDIIYRYLEERLTLGEGSIGKSIYASDVVKELYQLTSTNNDVTRQLVEYVKVDLNGVVPFSYPVIGNKAYVTITDDYPFIEGDDWVIMLSNLVCKIGIKETDTLGDVFTRMRDKILEVTPFNARVVALDVALDAFGNPLPIEIDPPVGETMLIGTNTPYNRPTQLIAGAAVGTTLARVVQIDSGITVNHYYYSSPEGRRPMIPLRLETVVNFTAPIDTDVRVYTRMDKNQPSTELLVHTIPAGETYQFISEDQHTVQLEYVNDSDEDVTAEIIYPVFETSSQYGLIITVKDGFGSFELKTTSGDLVDYTRVSYTFSLPVESRDFSDSAVQNIRPSSFSIIDTGGMTIIRDRGDGSFEDISGKLLPSGSINYRTGEVTLPTDGFADGDYYFRFDQNIFNNFAVDETTAIDLILPKPSMNSFDFSLSEIRVN